MFHYVKKSKNESMSLVSKRCKKGRGLTFFVSSPSEPSGWRRHWVYL